MEPGNQITKTVHQWHSRTELFVFLMGAYQGEYGPHKCNEGPAGILQWEEGKGLFFTIQPKHD